MIWRLLLPFVFFFGTSIAITSNCHSSCASCAMVNDSSACTSCSPASNYLILTNDNYGVCGSQSQCTSAGGLTLTSGSVNKCFISGNCPPGYYANNSTCNLCDSTCKECSGKLNTQCLSCADDKTMIIDFDDSGKCIAKTSCNGTLLAGGKLCVGNVTTNSSSNSTTNSSSNSTTTCAASCATCYTNSSSHCKTCTSGASPANLIQAENNVTDERWGSCSSTISLKRKYYTWGFDPTNVTNQFKCHWTCSACISENDPNACTACSNAAYLKIISEINGSPVGSCRPSCSSAGELSLTAGSRKYCSSSGICPFNSTGLINQTNSSCSRIATCDAACALCDPNSTASCSVCASWTDWLKVSVGKTGACVASTTTGSKFSAYDKLMVYSADCLAPFNTADTLTCKPTCTTSDCTSCGASACWKCKSSFVVKTSTSNHIEGTCSSGLTCDSGYALSENTRCEKCYSTCKECSIGFSLEKCTSCNTGSLESSSPSICVTGGSPNPNPNPNPVINAGPPGGSDGWYVGAIVIGVITMTGFLAFVIFLLVKWPNKDAGSPSPPVSNPPAISSQANPSAEPGPAPAPESSNPAPAPVVEMPPNPNSKPNQEVS